MTESLVARGRVLAVHAHDAVTVECAVACPGCRCGRYLGPATRRIELPMRRSSDCKVGSRLEISASAAELLRVAAWVYGLPWSTTLLGTLLGVVMADGDAAALLGAVVGLAVGLLSLKLLGRTVATPHLEVRAAE